MLISAGKLCLLFQEGARDGRSLQSACLGDCCDIGLLNDACFAVCRFPSLAFFTHSSPSPAESAAIRGCLHDGGGDTSRGAVGIFCRQGTHVRGLLRVSSPLPGISSPPRCQMAEQLCGCAPNKAQKLAASIGIIVFFLL